ncbi:hypothetical protein BH11MYX1_BH11MYX1_28360 [soil metagenome]
MPRLHHVTLVCSLVAGCLAGDDPTNGDDRSDLSAGTSAATASISVDSFVASETPTIAHDTLPVLAVGTAGSNVHRTYLKLAVTGIPAGATQLVAKLALTSQTTASTKVTAHCGSSSGWTGASLTWQVSPAYGGAIASITTEVSGNVASFDVGACVTGNGTFTVVLDEAAGDPVVHFASMRAAAGKPSLAVTYAQRWTFTGGGVHGGGFQNGLAFAPDDHDIVLSAADVSGIQRSTDGGAHWTTSDLGLSEERVATVVFDGDAVHHAGRAYAGGGSGNGNVVVSEDYGVSWTTFCPSGTLCPDFQANNGVPHQATEHPRSTGHLIEVVHPSSTTTCLLAASYDQGLERSRSEVNGGEWSVLGLGPSAGAKHYLRGLAYDAATDTAYVSSVSGAPVPVGQGVYKFAHACSGTTSSPALVSSATLRVEELAWIGGALYTAGDTGVFRFTPGSAWTPRNDGLPTGGAVIYESIAGVPDGAGVVLFVGAANAAFGKAVLRWNGTSWSSVSTPGNFTTQILGITTAETWWLTGGYLFDGAGYVAAQIVLDPAAGAPRVWVAGRSGVYRSNSCNGTFDHCTFQPAVNEMNVAGGRSIALDPRNDGVVYYGDTDYTLFTSTDGLVHVTRDLGPLRGNGRALVVDGLASAPGLSPVYIGEGDRNGNVGGAVYMKAGSGWQNLAFPSDTVQRVCSLAVGHPTDASGAVVLATLDGGAGIWRSDGGGLFHRISGASSAMTTPSPSTSYYQTAAMYWPATGAHTSAQRVYLYDMNRGLFCSDNGGKTFTTAPVWSHTGNRSSLAGNPADPSQFYLSNGKGLFRFHASLSGSCGDVALGSPDPVDNAGAAFRGLAPIAVDPSGRLWVPGDDGTAGQLFMSSNAWGTAPPTFKDLATGPYRGGARSVRELAVDHRGHIYFARADNAAYLGVPN